MNATQKIITDSNKSPLVQVLTLMFLVITVLSCFVRVGTKIHTTKSVGVDDVLTIVATVLAIAQSIAVWIGCEHGLGQHLAMLSSTDSDTFFKTQYAINTMFVASLLCCKLSGTMSLQSMSREDQRWVIIGCEVVVVVWGITALIVSFFQCQLPTPWLYADDTRCIDRTAFWTYYSVANIATDIAIIAIMCRNVVRIHTSSSKKILVMTVFGSRIFVTPAIAVQIYYSSKAFSSMDFSFSIWPAAIVIQLVQCLAIVTACVPNFKPFLDSLESGQIRVDDLRRKGKSNSNGYPASYRPGYAGKSGSKSGQNSAPSKPRPFMLVDEPTTSRTQRSEIHEMVDFPKSKGASETTVGEHGRSWDGQSQTSQSSQAILVHQSWQVEVESMHERGSRRE